MRNYLYLLQIFGGGNPAIHKSIEKYGSAEKAVAAMLSGDTVCIPMNIMERYKKASLEMSDTIIAYCAENKIDIITIDDKRYPTRLKNIFNPPVLLFVDGDLSCLENHLAISVVGPRKTDGYIERLALNICGGLAGVGCVLVSGFAKGIDRIACKAALDFNRATIAVLACGITIEYPAETFPLRAEIKKRGGAVISELLPDAGVTSDYFKTRNRIISGLTPATCVIGGNNHSGTMLTAGHAFEQDRDLFFTMPPDTLNTNYSSVIKYLRDGAHPVYDFYDILNEYYGEYEALLDGSKLDKTKLCYFAKRLKTQPETIEAEKAVTVEAEKPVSIKSEKPVRKQAENATKPIVSTTIFTAPIMPAEKLSSPKQEYTTTKKPKKSVKATTEKSRSEKITVKAHQKAPDTAEKSVTKFKISIPQDDEQQHKPINYAEVTPAGFMKKKLKNPSKLSSEARTLTLMAEAAQKRDMSDSDFEEPPINKNASSMVKTDFDISGDKAVVEKVLEALKGKSLNMDALLKHTDADYGELSLVLTELELNGIITGGIGGIYSLEE